MYINVSDIFRCVQIWLWPAAPVAQEVETVVDEVKPDVGDTGDAGDAGAGDAAARAGETTEKPPGALPSSDRVERLITRSQMSVQTTATKDDDSLARFHLPALIL